MKAVLVVVAVVLLSSCKRREPSPGPDAAPHVASATPSPAAWVPTSPPSASASASASAAIDEPEPHDFEDEFAYGGLDAGVGDPAKLTSTKGVHRYVNGRFGFSVDVPNGLVGMPEPDNGDGMQWRLGNLVVMAASGTINVIDLRPACARSRNVTAHKETETTCWATGKRGGFIFWERYAQSNDVMYSIRIQYAESLKATMDPIITQINASWKY